LLKLLFFSLDGDSYFLKIPLIDVNKEKFVLVLVEKMLIDLNQAIIVIDIFLFIQYYLILKVFFFIFCIIEIFYSNK